MLGFFKQHRWATRNAALRLTNSSGNGHRRPLLDRAALARLAIGLTAACATIAVIGLGGPPFSYRVGQTVQRDIRAKVRFEHVNEPRTALRRAKEADAVPPVFDNEPGPIAELASAAESLVQAIADVESFDDLSTQVASEWELTTAAFAEVRGSVSSPEESARLVKAIRSTFRTFEAHGLLDAKATPPAILQNGRVQVSDDSSGATTVWDVRRVERESLLDSKGPLVQALVENSVPSEVAERWLQVLRPRLIKLPATLKHNADATDLARQWAQDTVPLEKDTYNRSDRLVEQDKQITPEHLALLRQEHIEYLKQRSPAERFQRTGSLSALVLALSALAGYYIVRFERRVARSLARLAFLGLLVVVTLGMAKRLHGDLPHGETIPIALAGMTLAIVYSQQFALLISFGMGLLCAWMFGTGVNDFVVLTGGTAAAVLSLTRVRTRTKLISVGTIAGATCFALTWATGLLNNQSADVLLKDGFFRLLWAVFAGFLMGGSLPFLEKTLGVVTDINLLELSDVSHPLLVELMRRAPGTYNHSIAVATLAEAAAEQIGANSLLVRVGSYFHDVGKMLKPHYFVENQTDDVDRHATLNPAMSTLIIIGHVKDGANLAHQHGLPQPIIDLIEQHHGTTLVEYFYNEAAREVEENGEEEADVQESAFRYPGPKPQSKEASVVMLADAVESASRTLSEPTPGRIEGLVHELTLKRLLDGQFDECSITMHDIGDIKESLIKSLNAIYHGRVKYPEPRAV